MADWIIHVIDGLGYVGVFLLMVLENVFPPVPSELIMPFAGFLAARGGMNPVLVVLVGSLGSLVGALPWYYAGRKLGPERLKRLAARHGRWVAVNPVEIGRAQDMFERRGALLLVFGRLVPTIRSVVALPAGVAGTHLLAFSLWTLLGSALWTGLLTLAGYLLEDKYERIQKWLNPVSTGIFILIAIWYVIRVVRHPSSPTR
jgi:membrane protein DedA with SNARE-associated domain